MQQPASLDTRALTEAEAYGRAGEGDDDDVARSAASRDWQQRQQHKLRAARIADRGVLGEGLVGVGVCHVVCGGARACSRRTAGAARDVLVLLRYSCYRKRTISPSRIGMSRMCHVVCREVETAMLWPVAKARMSD